VNKGNNRRKLPLTHSIFSVTVSLGMNPPKEEGFAKPFHNEGGSA
jgi:hypothetical protein